MPTDLPPDDPERTVTSDPVTAAASPRAAGRLAVQALVVAAVFFAVNAVTGFYWWYPERTIGALVAPNLAAVVAVAAGLALGRRARRSVTAEPTASAAGRRAPRAAPWLFAAVAAVFLFLAVVEAATQYFFDRSLDVRGDLGFFGGVASLVFGASGTAAELVGYAIVVIGFGLLLGVGRLGAAGMRAVFARAQPGPGAILIAAAIVAVPLLFTRAPYPLAVAVVRSLSGERPAEFVELDLSGGAHGAGVTAAGSDAPAAEAYAFPRLRDADVQIVLVESYGNTVFSNPVVREGLFDFLVETGRVIESAGYHVASHFLESPIVGGYSWLAHATLFTGQHVASQPTLERLMASPRTTLFSVFRDAGYRAVVSFPGTIHGRWDEGQAYYGFDEVYYHQDFGYRGPMFSYVPVPDQFSMDFVRRRQADRRAAAQEAAPGVPAPPELIVHALVSSHGPFNRIPPYIDDWDLLGDGSIYHDLPIETFANDWFAGTEWDEGYTAAIRYALTTIREYLTRFGDDTLFVILGDHQPGRQVRPPGDGGSAPIHYVSRNRELIDHLVSTGFVPGFIPTQPEPHPAMETFLAQLVDAVGR